MRQESAFLLFFACKVKNLVLSCEIEKMGFSAV